MPADLDLVRIQRWMQAVIVAPGDTAQALGSSSARAELDPSRLGDLVLPSATLTPLERLGVYHRMYFLRMHDALQDDYPATAHFLGDDGFAAVVRSYLEAFPSRSYTLNRLGDRLPEHLDRVPGIARRAFLRDLSRLERAVNEVFDAPSSPPLEARAIDVVGAESWAGARLRTVEAFRLLHLSYPASAYLESVRERTPHPAIRRGRHPVAVYRRGLRVRRLDLDPDGARLLEQLAAGEALGQALAAVARGRGARLDEQRLFRWLRDWVGGGVFRAIEPG